MKKLIALIFAMAALITFSTAAMAVEVSTTQTSPTIYKKGCEKAGAVNWKFPGGSEINPGDWWYMDLSSGVTLCKPIDYIVASVAAANQANPNVTINSSSDWALYAGFNGGQIINMDTSVVAPSDYNGPLSAGDISAVGMAVNAVSGNMAFRVVGNNGTNRVTVYALGSAGMTGESLKVETDHTLNFKILDGTAWNDTTNRDNANTVILLDLDDDGTYGEVAGDVEDSNDDEVITGDDDALETDGIPYVENTLCINATAYNNEYVYTTYASKGDQFTFTGDTIIAHSASASALSLVECGKQLSDNIAITSQGGTECDFEYEIEDTQFCENDDNDDVKFKNRILIESNTGSFGDIDDKYTLTATITSPANGVYFGGGPTVYGVKTSQTECSVATTDLSGLLAAGNFKAYAGSKATDDGWPDNSCTVKTTEYADTAYSDDTFELDGFDTIFVDFQAFVFDNTAVEAGEEVTIEVTLNRYPCGTLGTFTRTIGTFVTECTTAASTTLYFPWLPGTAAAGWWGGYVITNVGDTDGTATLTYNDSAGGTATATTGTIVSGAQYLGGTDSLTDVDGYDASLNYSVEAACGFTAVGFAFCGNGDEGTGYLADN